MLAAARAVGATDVERFAHGTTVATNALLERRGARTAFVGNAGFEHLLHLRRQTRAHLYRLCDAAAGAARPARALLRRARAASARTASSCRSTSRRCRTSATRRRSRSACSSRSATVGTSARWPTSCGGGIPGVHVVASHEVAPEFREYERASTTAADAYLAPVAARYLRALAARRGRAGLPEPLVMLSSGGVATVGEAAAHPATILVSGPAAGVVGAGLVARRAGFEHAIAFDMGGTSTDVCLLPGGRAARVAERTVAGLPIRLPTVDLHTVGAGGGSLVRVDAGGAMRVGPESAGAHPGPACYGARRRRRRSPTRISCSAGLPAELPGGLVLDRDAAERALAGIDPQAARRRRRTRRCCARCASSRSSAATIRATSRSSRSAARGRCTRARSPRSSGSRRCSFPRRPACCPRSASSRATSAATASSRISARSPTPASCRAEGTADLRYRGQSFELSVPLQPELAQAFHRAHEERYGYADEAREIELVAVRTAEVVAGPDVTVGGGSTQNGRRARGRRAGRRDVLGAGRLARRDERRRHAGAASMNVELQVIGSSLRAVAEEMGAVLIRSAFSANIKERRDCSTAVFDDAGRMIAQAEHIPVHLGAMPDAVAAAMRLGLEPGETCILNDPFTGGTHLPDVTLVSRTVLGYAVSRAHHADVGGHGAREPARLLARAVPGGSDHSAGAADR